MNAYTTETSASKFVRSSLASLLMMSLVGLFACTKRPVLTGTDDTELKSIEAEDTEPKKLLVQKIKCASQRLGSLQVMTALQKW